LAVAAFILAMTGCKSNVKPGYTSVLRSSASTTAADEYHVVDPAKAGFKLVVEWKSLSQDASGELVAGDLTAARVDDQPSPFAQGNLYPIELLSNRMTGGKIRTKEFGDILIRADESPRNFEMKMTDRQVKEIQNFLSAKKR
ncbi:MAG: hypothetical protein WBD19_15655, partial [Candidatus Acidiferrum sp.]